MKRSTFAPMLVSMGLLLLITAACTATTGQTAGQYVDDSTITSSVKAKLVAEKASNLTRVDVDTTNRVVSLNGVVESAEQKARAERLAMEVSGVRKVDNNLQIQKRN
jgi:hyperosmotically inducible protein